MMSATWASPDDVPDAAVLPYLRVREGLPEVGRKLAKGPICVGYLGGSLTMMKEGWRPLFHTWLNTRFPNDRAHRALHVGRGGVGSVSGAFFVQDEICGHDPDVVFVEYAINDSYDFLTPPALRRPAIEGIVRSIRLCHPTAEICLVYMHHVLRGEEIRAAVEDYESLADHYGLPSIHVGRFLLDRVEEGAWSFRGEGGLPALLRDECHPLPEGNRWIADLIAAAFLRLIRSEGGSAPRALPPACSRAPLVGGRVIPVDPSMIDGPYELESRKVGNYAAPVTWYALPEGTRLRWRAGPRVFGLFVVVGPRSGVVRAEAGGDRVEVALLDRWCTYERISTCILARDGEGLGGGKGDATIELSPEAPDYAACPKLEDPPSERRLDVVGLFVL